MTGSFPTFQPMPKSEAVQVVVRCRPMSFKEQSQGHTQIVDMWPHRGTVHIRNPRRTQGRPGKIFIFDSVYDWNASQDDLYERTVRPLVYSVLDGFNGTIFAYGQTGTGKTYTMLGSRCNENEKGVISKCFEDIFRHIQCSRDRSNFIVRASYLEIYQEDARDLLTPDVCKKALREDVARGVYVEGLRSVVCKNIKSIERVMKLGNKNRATAATNMNEHSSRSHAIFQITIEMRTGNESQPARVGKLNLVDLAGSERQSKTGAEGERLKESGKINLSLSALGNVISALVDGKSTHIPYRDSKLTQLLQDSLGGNSKSIMIANIGPASYNYDESLMTLRYASRAKNINNKPTRNEDPFNYMLSRYNHEMRAFKSLMSIHRTSNATENSSSSSTEDNQTRSLSAASTRRAWTAFPKRGLSRRRRPHLLKIWKREKFHHETTVKMVRWIQHRAQKCRQCRHHRDYITKSEDPKPESCSELNISIRKLVDDLAEALEKKRLLLSLEKLENDPSQRSLAVRAFMGIIEELQELRKKTERYHNRQRSALLDEEALLRKQVALKQTVLNAFLADSQSHIATASLSAPCLHCTHQST